MFSKREYFWYRIGVWSVIAVLIISINIWLLPLPTFWYFSIFLSIVVASSIAIFAFAGIEVYEGFMFYCTEHYCNRIFHPSDTIDSLWGCKDCSQYKTCNAIARLQSNLHIKSTVKKNHKITLNKGW